MTQEMLNFNDTQKLLFKQILGVVNEVAETSGMKVPDIRLIRGAYNVTVRG